MAEIPIMFWLVGWLLGCFGCEGLGGDGIFHGFIEINSRLCGIIKVYALHRI